MASASLDHNATYTVLSSGHPSQQHRHYHATQRKEIIPVILGVFALFIGRYSWKAMTRMDEEWEDYRWRLQQYERQHGVLNKDGLKYPNGTIAIDLGTFYLKLAKDKALIGNREGARFTFGGVVMDGDETLVGQRAFDKFYETQLLRPNKAALAGQQNTNIRAVVQSALQDMLERSNADLSKVRTVVTVPPLKWEGYETAFSAFLKDATLVPEPVAAIWGAQAQKELPDPLETPVLVIDIGALETTLSVVQKDVILSTTTLDNIGGDLFVQAIVDHVVSGRDTLRNDGMALQRIYMAAHAAVAELNTKNHAELHIPYIGMNLETRQPEHLEERVARTVIEQKVANTILTTMDSSKLSPHMPPPSSLSFLWMSMLTQLLEVTGLTPLQLSHILIVGGGAKHPLMETSIKDCFVTLQGNSDTVVVPQERSEMVVQGASSMLPNYRYDTTSGLVRDEVLQK